MPKETEGTVPKEFMTADDLMSDPLGLRSNAQDSVHEQITQTQGQGVASSQQRAESGIPIPTLPSAGTPPRQAAVQVTTGLQALIRDMAAEAVTPAEPPESALAATELKPEALAEEVGSSTGVTADQGRQPPAPPATAPPKIITRPRRQAAAFDATAQAAPLVSQQPPRHWAIQQWQDVVDAFSRFEPRAVFMHDWWGRWWPAVLMPLLCWAAAGVGAIVLSLAWPISLGIFGVIVGYVQVADCENFRKKISKR